MSISISAIIGAILLIIIIFAIFRVLMSWASRGWAWPAPWVELAHLLLVIIVCAIIAWALGVDIPFIHLRA